MARRVLIDDITRLGQAAFHVARKVITKKLAIAPEQYGAHLHAPLHGLYKLKSGHVRIAYHIEHDAHEVWILMIGDPRTIWESGEGGILARLGEERR